jgi:hypothetical protein
MKLSRREFSLLISSVLSSLSVSRAGLGTTLRVRRDINTIGALELGWFRDGVAAMRALPASTLTSLQYQSNIHGAEGVSSPGVPPEDFEAYFNKCDHGTNFLSWHRWYTRFWEQIVRELCGVDSFNLPYWDSVADGGILPEAVREPADTASNSLFDESRYLELNGGTGAISGLVNDALLSEPFAQFSFDLNSMPHGRVHNQMGGHMLFAAEAALDPIFLVLKCFLYG